jgi:hypothetical protein
MTARGPDNTIPFADRIVAAAAKLVPIAVTLAAGAAVFSTPAAAQGIGGGGLLQSYTFDDAEAAGLSEFRLMSAPFAVVLPIGDRLSLLASGAFAEGRATGTDGSQATLSGLTDTEVGVAFALGPDRVVLTAGAALPTGQSTHSLEEAAVAGVVAAELLPFAVTNWGSGGGVGGDMAVAFQSGAWGIGLAGGYRAASEYEPLTGETFAYRPGNQIRARVALDRDVGTSSTFSILVGVQQFTEDQMRGSNLFQSGNRLEGMMSYAFPIGLRSSALLYGGAYHRAQGALLLDESALDGAGDSPSQQLFTGGLDLRIPLGRKATFLPGTEMRAFRSADGIGQGWIGTAGATLELIIAGRRFGPRTVLSSSARFRMGHVIIDEDSESNLMGWEAGITLRVETGR